MIEGALMPVDGFFEIPDSPGWGVDIVDDVIQAHPYRGAWHRPDRVNPETGQRHPVLRGRDTDDGDKPI